jgi:CDP-diacylglycerol--serine O-phosphatidyltransferase
VDTKLEILKELKLKDLVTLMGTTCGILSIVFSIDGRYLWIAASCIYFAMVFDLLDGYVAKFMKQANELGKYLDSLSDCICFGVAPAMVIYSAYTDNGIFPLFVLTIFCVIYIFGAVLRLAWFNVSKDTGYEGVTTPITASIILSLFFIDIFYETLPDSGPILGGIMDYAVPIFLLILPFLNVSRFFIYGEDVRTRNNKRMMMFLILIMFFGLVSAILTFFSHAIVGPYIYVLCVSILVMLVFYLGIGVYNYIKRKNGDSAK